MAGPGRDIYDLSATPHQREVSGGPRLPADRRRQPLLRVGRRLHPSPAEGVRAAGGARRAGGEADPRPPRRQGQLLHPQPDLRPDHRAGLSRPDVPRSGPRGGQPARAHPGRADEGGVPRPRRAARGDGRAGSRPGPHVPDARVRGRAGPARRHRGDDGDDPRVQPVARRRLGLRLPGPRDGRAAAVARGSGRGGRRDRLAEGARRARRARAPGSGSGPRRRPVVRRPRVRPGVGPARGGRPPGGVPPRRQRLHGPRRDVGWPRPLRAVPPAEPPRPAARVRPRDPRHHRLVDLPRRVHPPPRPAGGEHRERLRVGAHAGEAAPQARQPDPVGVPRRPARRDPPPRVGCAVLRGGHPQARRHDRRGADPLRVRLAPRRRPRRAARLREGAPRVRRRRGPRDPARQLPRAHLGRACDERRRGRGRLDARRDRRGLARRVLGPRPRGRGVVAARRRGGMDGAALPGGVGRPGYGGARRSRWFARRSVRSVR